MTKLGGRPGLVVMGGDSCPEGHGSESQHHILDGHFSPIFLYKNCNVCLKKMKINEKEVRIGPFKKKFYDDIVNQNDNQSILYVRYSILIDRKLCRYKVLL